MSGKFFFSWCLRVCTWVSVGGRFLFFSLMFENLLLDDLDQKRKVGLSLFFWNGLSSSSLRYLSCDEDVFLLSWCFEDLLFDDLDQKRKIFLLLWCNVSVGGENFFFILIFENLFRWSRSLKNSFSFSLCVLSRSWNELFLFENYFPFSLVFVKKEVFSFTLTFEYLFY